MNNISILDCTLRDGGYINKFNFGEQAISKIITKLGEACIDIIECGFLITGESDKNKSLFDSVESISKSLIEKRENTIYVAMIAYGDISIQEISSRKENSIDGIRITFHENEIDEAIEFGNELMSKGYLVFMQPVGTAFYTDAELISLVMRINQMQPYAFYLVDTLGTMYKNDILRLFYLVDHNLKKDIAIGYHSHNNLQLAFSNAQELTEIHTNRHIILDSSVFGMGRGAGNLASELITRFINDNIEYKYDVIPLIEIVDEHLGNIFSNTSWGYSVPYYVASTNYCHPNYASYLMDKQTLSVKSINTILQKLPENTRHLYNSELAEDLYKKFQNTCIEDADTLSYVKEKINSKKVVVIAPGKSLESNYEKINAFINEDDSFVISTNFIPDKIKCDLLFISNNKRFKQIGNLDKLHDTIEIVSSSNIYNPNGLQVNYNDLINLSSTESDNAGIMCLKMLKKIGVKEIYLAGFDGFEVDNKENYIDKLILNVSEESLRLKNEEIKSQIQVLKNSLQIRFITKSKYQN